ncbi:MAG: Ig-like domain-containing protein, partial [Desulfobacterales bacterium]|nr:Ig-like domain-containing protein [Desulfobacterales bacterium]
MADTKNSNASEHTGTTPNKTQTQPVQPSVQAHQDENRVVLSAPVVEGQYQAVAVVPGMTLQVAFDLSQVTVDQIGKDLYLFFDQGASIVLKGFALLENSAQAPKFLLPDGTELTSKMLLSALDTTDVEPTAGPSAQGGGVGEYQDDPGAILKGIDKLDGLDFAQGREQEPPVIDANSSGEAIETTTDDEEELPDLTPPYIDVEDGGLTNDNTPTINGTAEPGSTIIVEVGGVTMATIADADGNWSVTVPDGSPLSDGSYTITATATNNEGEISSDTGNIGIDTVAVATIALDPDITPDDIINATEAGMDIAITGTVGGDVQDGETVTLTVNGNTYTGTVSDGAFSIDVPGSALVADGDNTIEASVVATDELGNTVTATTTESYGVDTTLPTATISLDANITSDDVINAAEAGSNIAITGTVGGDVQNGDTVTLTVGGNTYTGQASNGTFSIDVPGSALAADSDATIHASVTTTDAADNSTTATDTEGYGVDTTLPTATIALDGDITSDDVINAAEAGTDIAITGT